eukprot:CAMPEP_0116554416 /NCGR_PEP_ID=MMETSP0397-20121206/7582_1 /TAXON_ID=216820 /ORGANISM="Cyclophora tenuis, Strain ECT3854" /LENGTH=39 /DNA_ID= /DNA_START= /DNA_END= /DNA_ORIENTATION=
MSAKSDSLTSSSTGLSTVCEFRGAAVGDGIAVNGGATGA